MKTLADFSIFEAFESGSGQLEKAPNCAKKQDAPSVRYEPDSVLNGKAHGRRLSEF
ncbi:MAG: hypothetical protein Q8K50_21250 [Hydrogenophaga sp.]|nr:hypothetical protein [Hydrogenophaga sp.]MDP2096388.1 hypothetical protein [Hydrogenophaga sp.]